MLVPVLQLSYFIRSECSLINVGPILLPNDYWLNDFY